jgi:hypothetical protein
VVELDADRRAGRDGALPVGGHGSLGQPSACHVRLVEERNWAVVVDRRVWAHAVTFNQGRTI